nr:PREDICTED: macrophage mannose receptor 1-like [Latimeria chalumnae]|eukprot:XP_014353349.1 PREDICTED: macrophage mannose receptor 1-like [Latimeria chalumnae]
MDTFFTLLLLSAVASVISQHVILQYHFVKEEKTWGEAQNYCRAHYQDLISIHSAQQMETIRNISGVNNEEALFVGEMGKLNAVISNGGFQGVFECETRQSFLLEDKTSGQREYHISSEERSWFEALEICRRNYTDLTSIHSPEQLQEIQSKIGNKKIIPPPDDSIILYEKKTWFEALEICRENYTDLVSVCSQKELEEIKNISGRTSVWIRLYRNVWQWSNGDLALFQNWNTGEPDNAGKDENCVGMWIRNPSAGKWKDSRCSEETYFLCSQDTTPQFTTDATITTEKEATSPSPSGSTTLPETTSPSTSGSPTPTEKDISTITKTHTNQSKYLLVKENKTWIEALNYCRTNHTDLASIHNATAQTEIEELAKTSSGRGRVWIGLRRDRLFGFLFWMDNHEIEFSNWGDGSKGDPFSDHCRMIDKEENFTWRFELKVKWQQFILQEVPADNFSERSRYHFIQEKKTWFEALEICREKYTDLVSVRSQKELEEIKNISGTIRIWIGLYRNVWQWSNGDPTLFQNWNTGEPDNAGKDENCVGMWIRNPSAGKWKDSRCSEETYFLCYRGENPVIPSTPAVTSEDKYILVKENKTWIEALNYCRTNHTDLASIPNATAQMEIAELAKTSSGGGGVWIGLRRDRLFGFWFWMDDDESEYSNWGDGSKGDPFSDHCGMIDMEENFTWRFECCSTKLNFICY